MVAMSASMSSVLMVSTSLLGSTRPATLHHVGVTEETHDFADGVRLADVREELVAEALPLARSGHQTRDVDELDRGGHDLRRMVDLGQRLQAVVGHRHDAHVGLDGGERVIGGQTALVGHRREQRGLADIRQPHDTD